MNENSIGESRDVRLNTTRFSGSTACLFRHSEENLQRRWLMAKEPVKGVSPPAKLVMKPTREEGPNPLLATLNRCQNLRDTILKESNPENCQTIIQQLDSILKDIAQLQKDAGAIRKEAGVHVSKLRLAKPKGKPAEGTIREIRGSNLIFLDGSWQPYSGQEPTKETEG